ncbi:MAG: exo-alpha-sialidase [Pirellulales bacterium]|nr:exo-alpha-sialidase [Pirellulales bacterium]
MTNIPRRRTFGDLSRRGFLGAAACGTASFLGPSFALPRAFGGGFEKDPQKNRATEIVPVPYDIRLDVISEGHDGKTEWFGPRAGIIPPNKAVLLMHRSALAGDDVFLGMYDMRSDDLGKTWSAPKACAGLERKPWSGQVEICPCDLVPGRHGKSGKLLALGATACYLPEAKKPLADNSQPAFATYSVYDEDRRTWSSWQSLEMPDKEHFYWAYGGAAQRVDLPGGEILWPMYCMDYKRVGKNFRKSSFFTTIVKCSFDGRNMQYLTHGDELTVKDRQGLAEPSLTQFQDRFYLTLRGYFRGYVAVGRDGLHFEKPVPWTFDDGTELGSHNTQQHWITHSDGLFLVYTRRGAGNDHIIRNRAPLFMAQVDPERLCVLRGTERILLPNKGGQYGNFGAVNVSSNETWITEAEGMQGDAKKPMDIALSARRGANNRLYVCRILWRKPNRLAADPR